MDLLLRPGFRVTHPFLALFLSTLSLPPLFVHALSVTASELQPPGSLSQSASDQPANDWSGKSVEELVMILTDAKKMQPATPSQYVEMQRLIRDAAKAILKKTKDQNSELFRSVEFDYHSSSVNLLGNDGEQAPLQTYKSYRDYLREKKTLNLSDVRIALLAGQNLERLKDLSIASEAYGEMATILEEKGKEEFQEMIALFKASQKRLGMIGKKLELHSKTVHGEEFQLEKLRGKIVVLHIWATWSQPCLQEYSHLQRLYKALRDQGLEVVGISIDEKKEELLAYIKKSDTRWLTLFDDTNPRSHPFVEENGFTSLPTSIVLDREGKVIAFENNSSALALLLDRTFHPPIAESNNP